MLKYTEKKNCVGNYKGRTFAQNLTPKSARPSKVHNMKYHLRQKKKKPFTYPNPNNSDYTTSFGHNFVYFTPKEIHIYLYTEEHTLNLIP